MGGAGEAQSIQTEATANSPTMERKVHLPRSGRPTTKEAASIAIAMQAMEKMGSTKKWPERSGSRCRPGGRARRSTN